MRPGSVAIGWTTAGALFLVGALAFAGVFLLPLSVDRVIHVDEAQIAYNAALLGLHHRIEDMNVFGAFLVPLSWISAGAETSWEQFVAMRRAFFGLFLLNCALVALASPAAHGFAARATLFAAFLLVEPFWRHGFEIRHDGIMLCGTLALYALAQGLAAGRRPSRLLFAAGAIAAILQVNSFKSFLVWPPALLLLLFLSRRSPRRATLTRDLFAVATGFVAGVVAGFALLASGGIAGATLAWWTGFAGRASRAGRFSPGDSLLGLGIELPHLVVLAVVGAISVAIALRRRAPDRPVAALVTWFFLLLALAGLLVNPVPFPYNFVHLVPFLFLAAVDGFAAVWRKATRPARVALVLFAVASSVAAAFRSWSEDEFSRTTSAVQKVHVEAVEELTSPADPVYDGAGLVLSRRPPGPSWLLHSLLMHEYYRGGLPTVRQMLADEPAPVLLSNFRWQWLRPPDLEFVRSRYLPTGIRLLLLGGSTESAEESFEIHRAGRYSLAAPPGISAVLVDGVEHPVPSVAELAIGSHATRGGPLLWIWVGPRLDRPHDPGELLRSGDLFLSD